MQKNAFQKIYLLLKIDKFIHNLQKERYISFKIN